MKTHRMSEMTRLGADWWNDSGVPSELGEAVSLGAVGGTSNPVIVAQAAKANPLLCTPILERLVAENSSATEDEVAWQLIHQLGILSAAQLQPVFDATNGVKGFLSMQVNPKFYPNKDLMVRQAQELSRLAPNIAIKVPATEVGILAMEEMTGLGIRVNATVSFSVAQALAISNAFERGLKRARASGINPDSIHPYITIMIGRVDDHLKRVAEAKSISVDAESLEWAGIAVFKNAHKHLKESGRPGTLLAAAYRHEGHWSQIIGREVLQTVPYTWWKKFDIATQSPALTLNTPVDPAIIAELKTSFPDFVAAFEPEGMSPREFIRYGASAHTLHQFLGGYSDLLGIVRTAMIR